VSTADLRQLYRDVILEHHRQPRNFRIIDAARKGEAYNRMCGDRVDVYVLVQDDVVADVSFQGTGCAIAMASASLMTERIKGRTIVEAREAFEQLRRMLLAPPGSVPEELDALTALAGVRDFPIRIKCATLPWQALDDALI
jgi:nitrogen fixation NifU-like protein